MAQKYSIAEARARLRAIVDQVESGLEVELTRRGRPVAVILSCREFDRLQGRRRHFRDAYRSFLEKHPLDDISLDPDFPSTRDKTAGRKVSL
jgi:prevent-host-death family protein